MATVGKMISDLQLRLTAGKPSDDFEVDWEQMRFWIDCFGVNPSNPFFNKIAYG